MKNRIILLFTLIGLTLMTTGCVSSYVKPIEPEAKPIAIDEGKALIVFYWDAHVPVGQGVFLLEDKKPVAFIGTKTKTFYQVTPGKHTYAVAADNFLMFGGFDFKFFDADVKAGEVYYIGATGEMPAGLSGWQILAKNPTMEDADKDGIAQDILPYLLRWKPYVMSEAATEYFESEKDDILPRYDEQYAEWKELDASERIKLRPSGLNQSPVKLHNGKYM